MDKNFNYLGGYGYGYNDDMALIPNDTVDEKIDKLVGNAPSDMDTIEELAAAVQELGGQDLSELREELEGKANTEDVNAALDEKADKSDVEGLFASVEYANNTITFYDKEGNEVGTVDATDFVKDGMIQSVVLNDNNELVITFNTDAGTDDITVSLGDAFDPSNYYTSDECNEKFATVEDFNSLANVATSGSYNDLSDTPTIPNVDGLVTTDAMNAALAGKMDNVTLATVATSGSYNDLSDTPTIPSVDGLVTEDAMTEALAGKMDNVTLADVATSGSYNDLSDTPTIPAAQVNSDWNAESGVAQILNKPTIPTVPTNVSAFDNDAHYALTSEIPDAYTKDESNNIFVSDSEFEDAINTKVDKTSLEDIVLDMSRRLNKLEATSTYLIDNNTDSADDITNMSNADAENAEITVASTDAIKALAEPKTFKSINVVGGELDGNTDIRLTAKDEVNVTGLTVGGSKGASNGKIIYATNEIYIDSVDINPGCTAYNVFEGSQDTDETHCIDKFTAKNITVNDVDLVHNVFNIYQLNDNAEVTISDSYFNLDVANSNVLRLSNITNANNVTVTFNNVDLTYENKEYSASDVEWAGLVIYQPYGSDVAYNNDSTYTSTWTFNFINCRYNGVHLTQNEVGTIRQLFYQYNVQGFGKCEEPKLFTTINIE